jgi:hypothetical protein
MDGQRHAFETNPAHVVQDAGWAPGSVWTGAENLADTGIRSPESPACSDSVPNILFKYKYVPSQIN